MKATKRARASGPVLHPRTCAVFTAFSCLIHLWIAGSGHHGAWLSLLMVGMAAVCLPCSIHIWRHSRVKALHKVTAAALAMVALHAVLLLGSAGGHSHAGTPVRPGSDPSGASQLLFIIGLELVSAMLAATLVARLRRPVHP
nr:hypothetical protein [Pseudarthrobacter sp. lyk4-40-TYG-27]